MLNEINWSYNLLCDAQCCTYFALAVCNGWWTYNVFHCGSHSLEAWQENHSSTKPKHPNHLTALFRVSLVRQKMCRISLGRSCCSTPALISGSISCSPWLGRAQFTCCCHILAHWLLAPSTVTFLIAALSQKPQKVKENPSTWRAGSSPVGIHMN